MAVKTIPNLNRKNDPGGRFSSALRHGWRRHRLAYGMLLPAVLAIVVVLLIPMLWAVRVSFHRYDSSTLSLPIWDAPFVAMENYVRSLQSMNLDFMNSMQVTISFVIITLIASVVLGLGAALVGNSRFRGQTVFRGIMLIPFILPGVVSLTTFRFMLLSDGIINKILLLLGIIQEPIFWLAGANSFWAIIIGGVWTRFPLFFLTFLAALQAIPVDLFEAAEMDGASEWDKFRFITVPYLRGIGTILILMTVLWAYNNYMIPFVMLGGGYYQVPPPAALLSVDILKISFANLEFSYGAAQSIIMTILALIFVVIYLAWTQPQEIEGAVQSESRTHSFLRFLILCGITLMSLAGLGVILGDYLLKIGGVLFSVVFLIFAIRLALALGERVVVRVLKYLGMGFSLLLVLFPVYWLVTCSLKGESEIRQATWFPITLEWGNYVKVWDQAPLGQFFLNSILVSTAAMLLSVFCATLAGYAFSRFRFPGRDAFGFGVLVAQAFPHVLFLLPYFLIFSFLQRTPLFRDVLGIKFIGQDVYWGNILLLILTYTAFVLPFTLWLMRGFTDSIPRDLEESAEVDGASRIQALWRIILPIALPGIATVAILAFNLGWNEVLFSSVLTNPATRTLALGIQDYRTDLDVLWSLTMAAGVLISAPVVVFFTALQRYMVSGLTAGAVKG
ncbi:MAG: ABC transporter permease subunit [Chloroflexi bacterium]|nr:ABC transporter permease subunit [Chloroflexota bacterium]